MKKKPCSIEPVSSVCKTTIKRNKTMKNKLAIATAFIAASSLSMGEIVINDSLSFQGYVDSSYLRGDFNNRGIPDSRIEESQIDKVEVSWLFDFEAVTAQVDLEYDGVSSDITAQQAFVNYALSGGSVVTVGRYVTMLGFEAKKPTGLFQSSTAYDTRILEVDLDPNLIFEALEGVKYTVASDTMFFGISVGQTANKFVEEETYDVVEVAASLDLGGGFSIFAGGNFSERKELNQEGLEHYNTYMTYETGAWLFAAELNASNGTIAGFVGDNYVYSYLLMANYEYSDVASVTARFSALDYTKLFTTDEVDEAEAYDIKKYTLAHNYAFSESLLLVTEVSHVDYSNFDATSTQFAVELLFSF